MTVQRVLVAGAGLAGLRAVEALRGNGYAGKVLVVGEEPWMPYTRPPLSKAALGGDLRPEHVLFRRRATTADVEWWLGERIEWADLDAGRAGLASGETVSYDGLVAATGVSARRLPVDRPPAAAGHGRHVVRTFDDALALGSALRHAARVVIVGAGFIGCEVAATARALGCDVTCVAIDAAPMLRPLGPQLAGELQRRHESRGVRFRLGTGVASLTGRDRVNGVVLSDGTQLPADLVVEALGSRCNTDWLDGNRLDLSDGVRTDSALRALQVDAAGTPVRALPNVVVAGDVARFPNPRFHHAARRVEHWNLATDTGRRAGAVLATHLAGAGDLEASAEPWHVVPSFWSDQYDWRIQAYGMPELGDEDGWRLLEGTLGTEFVAGYHCGEDLIGVVGVGMTQHVNSFRNRVGLTSTAGTRQVEGAVG